MEKSFVLLSSMSPKINKHKKKERKNIPSVLATKKHFRRSFAIENADRTIDNHKLNIIEGSTDSSSANSNDYSQKKTKNHTKNKIPENFLAKEKVSQIEHWLETLEVDRTDKQNCTNFTEVSAIFGGDVTNFKPEGLGIAVNSTFANSQSMPFNRYFKKKCDNMDHKVIDEENNSDSSSDCILSENIEKNDPIVIDDSLDISLKDITNLIIKGSPNSKSENKNKISSNNFGNIDVFPSQTQAKVEESVIIIEDSFNVDNLRQEKISKNNIFETKQIIQHLEKNKCNSATSQSESKRLTNEDIPRNSDDNNGTKFTNKGNDEVDLQGLKNNIADGTVDLVNETDMEAMLDTIYGDKWRHNKENVLPKSEPRKNEPHPKVCLPNTERKPRLGVLKNNCEEFSKATLLKNVLENEKQKAVKKNSKQLVYDSDTDEDQYNIHKVRTVTSSMRTKLTFDNETEENEPPACPDLEINESLENLNSNDSFDSYLGETLEQRIRKQMNVLKEPSKRCPKNDTDRILETNKDNIEINKNKKDLETKKVKSKDRTTKKKLNSDHSGERRAAEKSNNKNTNNSAKKITTKTDNSTNKKNRNTDKSVEPFVKPSASTYRSDNVADLNDNEEDDEWNREITRIMEVRRRTQQFPKTTYGFLESLSGTVPLDRCDVSARIFRSCYKLQKSELARKLFKIFNEQVFDNCIPADTPLEWNDRLRGTAGTCHCKKITHRSGAIERTVKIMLSTKVLDSPDRLRDTLLHELCHAATWIVNCVSDGHGSYWKSWAFKAMRTFPELPPIKRCHDYVINTKYVYKCVQCSYSIGRHTKSLDIERKRCGYCYGKFEVLINKTTKTGETKTVPVTPRKEPSAFAMFVKEHYATHKSPSLKHGDVMKILGQKFSDLKVKQV